MARQLFRKLQSFSTYPNNSAGNVTRMKKKTIPYIRGNVDRVGVYESNGFLRHKAKEVQTDSKYPTLDLSDVPSGPFTLGGKPKMRRRLKNSGKRIKSNNKTRRRLSS